MNVMFMAGNCWTGVYVNATITRTDPAPITLQGRKQRLVTPLGQAPLLFR